MDEAEAVAAAEAAVARLLRRAEAAGVEMHTAAIEGIVEPPVPDLLPRVLRNAQLSLGSMATSADPTVFTVLEKLGREAPPVDAPIEDRLAWSARVQRSMEERIAAAGVDVQALRDVMGGLPVEVDDPDLGALVGVGVECAVLVLVGIYAATLAEDQPAFRRHMSEMLEALLLQANRHGFSDGPLRVQGVADQLVGPLATAYIRAQIDTQGREGTQLRVAIETRHGPGSANAVLARELPGAAEITRAEIGQLDPGPQSPSDVGKLLGVARSRAVQQVIGAQAPNHKRDGQWVVPLDIADLPDDDRLDRVQERAVARFELREALATGTLTPRERQVLRARMVDDLSGVETARRLGTTVDAVGVHLSNAKRKLRSAGRAAAAPP